MSDLLTLAEAQHYLKVSRATLFRLMRAGAFPVVRVAPRRTLVRLADLQAYVQRQTTLPAPPERKEE